MRIRLNSDMSWQFGVAIWSTVTGTIGLALGVWTLIWQNRARRRAPGPNLKVELSMMAHKPYMFGGVVSDAVLIQVTNRGPLPVRVVAVGFLMHGAPSGFVAKCCHSRWRGSR